MTIDRCVGIDSEGLLLVEESKTLRARIRKLHKCVNDPYNDSHVAGWRYRYLGMEQHFPEDLLQIRFKACGSKDEASREEARLMREYIAEHFELPPLNYKRNWKR